MLTSPVVFTMMYHKLCKLR